MAEVFNGVTEGPSAVVAPFGLLSVAEVIDHTDDEHWGGKQSVETRNNVSTVSLLDVCGDDITNGELFAPIADSSDNNRWFEYTPFGISVTDQSSTFGLLADDRIKRVAEQLELSTQRAVEQELWAGTTATSLSNFNPYLESSSDPATQIANAGSLSPEKALAWLEYAFTSREMSFGLQPVIHMPRFIAGLLGTTHLQVCETEDGRKQLQTILGTPVIAGTGYEANLAINVNLPASQLMYATGQVQVHLGPIQVVPDSLGQGAINPSVNDVVYSAERIAAVHYDPKAIYSVRVAVS